MFQIMEHKTKAVKMNDEINRNYCDDKKYIVKKKFIYSQSNNSFEKKGYISNRSNK